MKVSDLIQVLQQMPQDAEVFCHQQSEGFFEMRHVELDDGDVFLCDRAARPGVHERGTARRRS